MSSPGRRVSNASDSLAQFFFGVIRGLDRETDAALDFVHLDDARFDFLTDLEHVFDLGDVIFAQLRNVNEAIDVVLQLHERAEARQLCYLAVDQIADLVFLIDFFHGSSLSCLMPRLIRWLTLSMSMTTASTSSFFLNTSLG